MARGLKKHLKRLNALKHWMLDKNGGAFMLFQSPKRMRISGPFMTQGVGSVSTQIRDEEAKSKLCKVRSVQANDTIKLDLETNKITDFVKFNVGNVVMVTGGRNRGGVSESSRTGKNTREALRQSTSRMPPAMNLLLDWATCSPSARGKGRG
ncbi:hypothetical protein C1H46_022910 [Malus baccata]|uniref:Small ribosomal subunit protein eS4 N-terminal domain-containing protein n=1 Tax=Malus baccata TaxID=106549 RepID=A0A540LZ25_MALBA|nr:hypothetical protein C1H46_022910 [Malus baccata]